ncbi:MAG TPA: HlyD family efflux transporter periplasmic adaptor subunit [Thermoanaerobaculia bacterium]|nr:HlyD family efflux transporter periplasmic adaptor subunit [Thermoanaerobaculia bacterium]
MDREIASDVRRRQTTRRVAGAGVAIAALVFSIAATVNWLKPSIRRRDIETARVTRGSVDATLQAAGTVEPEVESVISSPVEARVLRIDRRAGDRLRIGDEILTLDTSAARLDLERLSDRVSQKESELAQAQLKVDENLASAAASLEQKRLDAEILSYKAEQNKRMHAEGLVSQQDELVAVTAKSKSDIELAQLREALARSRRTGQAQIAAAELELRTARKERDEAQRQLALAMARSNRAGVLTWVLPEVGVTVKRGDLIARVADLDAFHVVATISDIHAHKLAAGMRARVKLDDATMLDGTISSVDPRIENGVARFWVDLDHRAHPGLRNNLRVDVYAVVGTRKNVLRVHRGALGQGDREEVYVVRGGEIVRSMVHWGLAGEESIEALDGLREGDEVVTSNMSDYAGVNRLRLK